ENVIYKYWAVGSGSPLVYVCPALYGQQTISDPLPLPESLSVFTCIIVFPLTLCSQNQALSFIYIAWGSKNGGV
ncbi:hypothetical protein Gotur_006665, partial [Gossypium turneri]